MQKDAVIFYFTRRKSKFIAGYLRDLKRSKMEKEQVRMSKFICLQFLTCTKIGNVFYFDDWRGKTIERNNCIIFVKCTNTTTKNWGK